MLNTDFIRTIIVRPVLLVALGGIISGCGENSGQAGDQRSSGSNNSLPFAGGGTGSSGELEFIDAVLIDADRDGVFDSDDNCMLAPNADQADSGGIGSATADGIGDACQCGDFNDNGIVDNTDAVLIERYTLFPEFRERFEVGEIAYDKCDANGDGDCNRDDAWVIKNALLGNALVQETCGGGPLATWELVWSDEFTGTTLDPTKWEIQLGDGKVEGLRGWGNNEEQYYASGNVTVSDGNLVINARAETTIVTDPNDPVANVGTYDYTSGRIRTQGLFDFTYGRVEARIKLPAAQGLWNAFWLLGSDPSPYGTWAAKGEIDIFESYSRGYGPNPEPFVSSAIHFGGPFPYNVFDFESTIDFENAARTFQFNADPFPGPGFNFFDDYHTYAVEWDEEEIRFYIDGINFYSVKSTNFYAYFTDVDEFLPPQGNASTIAVDAKVKDVIKYSSDAAEGRVGFQAAPGADAPFDSLFHIILNSAVGGNLPNAVGEPPSTADLGVVGDDMLVDYVRVYRCNLADTITGLGGQGCKNIQGRKDIVMPENPDVAGETILPNFTNDLLAATSTKYDLFSKEFDIYTDGPEAQRIPDGAQLSLRSFGPASFTIETEGDNDYIRVTTTASGFQGIAVESSEPMIVTGIDGLADIKFDLYLESDFGGTTPDLVNGGPAGNQMIMRFAVTSGDDSEGNFYFIPLDEVGFDQWRRFTIPLNFLLSDGGSFGGRGLNQGDVSRLLELAFIGVNARIDNIAFACGGQPCGVVGEVNVFVDEVDSIWDRGIVGDDTFQRFRGDAPNPNYTDPDCCHVQWDEIATAETVDIDGVPGNNDTFDEGAARGTVVETRFGTTGTDGAVNFIGASNPFPSIAALRDGSFAFDIRVTRNDENAQLLFKIDADDSSTGELPLGDLNLNQWYRFECPITTLEQQGLNTARITAPFVLVPGNRGSAQGITAEWDNVRFSTEFGGSSTNLFLPVVFENLPGFCLPVAPFAGGAFSIVPNPDTAGPVNTNTRVGQVRKFDTGDPSSAIFGGVTLNLTSNIEFMDSSDPTNKLVTLKVYSPRAGLPVTIKLESINGSSASIGKVFTTTAANTWEDVEVDFNGFAADEFSGITFILDDGVISDGTEENFSALVDEIRTANATSTVADLGAVDNLITFDFDGANTVYPLTDFGEARSGIETNPPNENNGTPYASGSAGRVFLADFAQTFAGTILSGSNGFPREIPFNYSSAPATSTVIEIDVWVPDAGTPVELKVEDGTDAFQFANLTRTAPVAGWNTLSFDFSEVLINTADSFEKIVLIFNPGQARTNQTYYFDNIRIVP